MGFISEIFNFDNIGEKIKKLAKWLCWVNILLIWIASAISFFLFLDAEPVMCVLSVITAIVAPVFVWIGSWLMYAFGELVEDTHAIRNKEGTTREVAARRIAEEKAIQKQSQNTPVRARHLSSQSNEQFNTTVAPSCPTPPKVMTKYTCPVCKTSNSSFSPCAVCGYDPQLPLGENVEVGNVDFIDVLCPNCNETLSFVSGDKHQTCPYCGQNILL